MECVGRDSWVTSVASTRIRLRCWNTRSWNTIREIGDGLDCGGFSVRRTVGLGLVCFASVLHGAADYFPPPDAQGGWRALQDSAQIRKTAGIDKGKLDEAFE